jgi:GTP pyrophosphokinase
LRRYKRSLNKEIKTGRLDEVAREEFKLQAGDDLCVLVGYGKITPDSVLKHLVPEADRERLKDHTEGKLTRIVRGLVGGRTGIVVDGIDDMVVRFSKCCNPVPGDSVSGFVTRGRGVAVHTSDCRHLVDADPDRRIEVRWATKTSSKHPILVQVVSSNIPGILASVSQSFHEQGININQATCTTNGRSAINRFEVTVENANQLRTVMRSIERIGGVHSVERVRD